MKTTTSVGSRVLTAEALRDLVAAAPRARILDVRTPGEYESVHIEGAYNVPLDTLSEHAGEIHANVSDPVVLVCQSGARARQAEEALQQAGMPNLHILDGGMNGWLGADLPVQRGATRISLERQVRIAAGSLVVLGAVLALLVNPLFALLSGFVGAGLVFAGITDTCGMAMVLTRLPYNRPASCDVDAMVRALNRGARPAGIGRAASSASSASCSTG